MRAQICVESGFLECEAAAVAAAVRFLEAASRPLTTHPVRGFSDVTACILRWSGCRNQFERNGTDLRHSVSKTAVMAVNINPQPCALLKVNSLYERPLWAVLPPA